MFGIKRVKAGETIQAVEWNSGDELGQVIASFNEMQARQQAYETELRKAHDTLEQRKRSQRASRFSMRKIVW